MSKPLTSFYYVYRIDRIPKHKAFVISDRQYLDDTFQRFKTYEEAIMESMARQDADRSMGYRVMPADDKDAPFHAYVVAHKTKTMDYIMYIACLCVRELGEAVFPYTEYKDEHRSYRFTEADAQQDKEKLDYRLSHDRKHTVKLSDSDLDLLCDIFHGYKDYNRGSELYILPVMELEASLSQQTDGLYQPDTTYDIKD